MNFSLVYILRQGKLYFLLISILFNSHLNAQVLVIRLDNLFNDAVEISSISVKNHQIILTTEKCKQLFYIDMNGNIQNIISLPKNVISDKEVEIEGVSLAKNYFLLTDEKNAKIYAYHFYDSNITEVKTDYDLSGDTGSQGMEGIAVDTIANICYVLKERNGNSQSVIHVFKINEQNSVFSLSFIKNIYIVQPDNSWRYSDLCFNAKNKYLYCLKTKGGFYQIDTISTTALSQPEDLFIKLSDRKLFMDISAEINKYGRDGYNTNMEGIALNNDKIYLVSDNAQENSANCNAPGQGKTLLVQIRLN